MKVFWSWQSDRVPKNHHYFVRDALQRACELIALEADIEESERPEVDHDTKGRPGSPDIVKSIFDKIDAATVFVADVTPVASTIPSELRPDLTNGQLPQSKHLQNSNVMSELGYAEKALTLDRIILVANAVHYPGPEALPFDWRSRRGPLTYSLADDADKPTRKKELEQFAKKLCDPLRLIFQNQKSNTIPSVQTPLASASDASIWDGAENGVDLKESLFDHGLKKIVLDDGPRLYIKIIPTRWLAKPVADMELQQTRSNAKLWIQGASGTTGKNGQGAISAQHLGDEKGVGYFAGTMTQWFQESGVIWAVDTTTFGIDEKGQFISHQSPIAHLAKFINDAIDAIKKLGGAGPFLIEVGCTNLKGVSWVGNFATQRTPALKDSFFHSESRADWSAKNRNQFLWNFWNKLLDAFGLDPARSFEQFQKSAGAVLSDEETGE